VCNLLPFLVTFLNLLLGRSENRVLRRFRDAEFQNGFCGNFDLLACRGIPAEARLPLLLYELAEAGKRELALLLIARSVAPLRVL
jgi:hypothetical protein